jgi:hypothetical protein
MSNHPRVFERRDGDMVERIEVADIATAGWLVTRIVMTRHGVAVHAINIGNFDYLTETWISIETLISPDFVEMDNNGRILTGADAGVLARPAIDNAERRQLTTFEPRCAANKWRPDDANATKQTSPRRKQDRALVAGGQDYRYEASKTGISAAAVKKAVKKVGNSRKRVESRLGR